MNGDQLIEALKIAPVSVEKITRGIYRATAKITEPMNWEMSMDGKTEEIAKQKLALFLDNKPYKYLDNQ